MQHKAYPSGKFAKRQPMQRKENLPYRGKNISASWCPSKEKAGDLIKDFLLGGATGGQLAFGCKGSGQCSPKGEWCDKGTIIRSAHQQRFHIFQNTIQRYGQEKYFLQN